MKDQPNQEPPSDDKFYKLLMQERDELMEENKRLRARVEIVSAVTFTTKRFDDIRTALSLLKGVVKDFQIEKVAPSEISA